MLVAVKGGFKGFLGLGLLTILGGLSIYVYNGSVGHRPFQRQSKSHKHQHDL